MSRIQAAFDKLKTAAAQALIPFITAGDAVAATHWWH